MTEGFIGEVRAFSFNYAPTGWAMCNGQSLPIQQNRALYSLLGVQFGGDGKTTFNLPDLRGYTMVGADSWNNTPTPTGRYPQGNPGGANAVTLDGTMIPPHTHTFAGVASNGGTANNSGTLLAQAVISSSDTLAQVLYAPPNPKQPPGTQVLNPAVLSTVGAGAAHPNLQPYLALNFCIALTGYYPSRN